MLRAAAFRCLRCWDALYHRRHRLEPVGPVLFVGCKEYSGPPREFADGTRIQAGDVIGMLHFNNSRIAALEMAAPSGHRAGWQFARLLRESLLTLSAYTVTHPTIANVVVFQGTTWMQVHGLKVGFTAESLPNSARTRFLVWHFRLLSWAFAPIRRRSAPIEPRNFWITRRQLQQHFTADGVKMSARRMLEAAV